MGELLQAGLTANGLVSSHPPLLRALLVDQGRDPDSVNGVVHPDDEMFRHGLGVFGGDSDLALAGYYWIGLAIVSALRQVLAWKFGSLERVGRLLDFAGGYGRVTRFLAGELSPERVWVAEIQPSALEFQTTQFHVGVLRSTHRPEEFRCGETFDCVLVTSLFTHLPADTFAPWLGRIVALLRPGGLLLFSVHDKSLLGRARSAGGEGLRFVASSESRDLDAPEYGTTWVSEPFVREALGAVAPGRPWCRIPRGFVHHQDVYIVSNGPADFSRLRFDRGQEGGLETHDIRPEGLGLSGWAVARTEESRLESVRIARDGIVLAECRAFAPHLDVVRPFARPGERVVGWECRCPLPDDASPSDILLVKTVSTRGIESLLYAGRMDAAWLASLPARRVCE